MRDRCIVLRRDGSSINSIYLAEQCGLDVHEMDADKFDERDVRALLKDEPFAIVLPLSLPSFTSLRIAELAALEKAQIRLILVSGTQAPHHVLEDLFDCCLPSHGEGLVDALKRPTWTHAFERRKVSLDTAIQRVLETASCFWLSGGRHPETFASLVDYQKGISTGSRHFNVMLLASDPTDLSKRRVIKEFSEIESELSKRTAYSFSLKHVFSSRPDDLARRLLEEKPHIVHFSGHGDASGRLCFEDSSGRSWPADKAAIAQIFELCRRYIKCVVLNSCFSAEQAHQIGAHIEYAIGLNSTVPDEAAIVMARGFYGALSVTGRVSSAVSAARANLRLVTSNTELYCVTPMREIPRLVGQPATRQILEDLACCIADHVQLARAFRTLGEIERATHHLRLAAAIARDKEIPEYALKFETEADLLQSGGSTGPAAVAPRHDVRAGTND